MVALETALARSQWTRVENRDPLRTYNPMPSAVLASLAPGFDWSGYLAATGLAARTSEIVVRQPTYLPAFAALARATPLPVWKAYLRTHLLHAYAPYPPQGLRRRALRVLGTALRGRRERSARWKRGIALRHEQSIGEALGRLYVARHFPPASEGADGAARRQPARRLSREHRRRSTG